MFHQLNWKWASYESCFDDILKLWQPPSKGLVLHIGSVGGVYQHTEIWYLFPDCKWNLLTPNDRFRRYLLVNHPILFLNIILTPILVSVNVYCQRCRRHQHWTMKCCRMWWGCLVVSSSDWYRNNRWHVERYCRLWYSWCFFSIGNLAYSIMSLCDGLVMGGSRIFQHRDFVSFVCLVGLF